MSVTGEDILNVFRRAVARCGIDPNTEDVIARRRLEAAVEIEAKTLDRCSCGDFDWDEED